MKAFLNEQNQLVIYPENAGESYALEKWKIDNMDILDVCIDLEILNTYEVEKRGLLK